MIVKEGVHIALPLSKVGDLQIRLETKSTVAVLEKWKSLMEKIGDEM